MLLNSARKLQSVQEATCRFFHSLIPHWSPAPAWENPLFCRHFVKVNVWTALGGGRGRDGSRGWPLWNEEVALSTLITSWNLVWISSWTQRNLNTFTPSCTSLSALLALAAPHSYPAPVSLCVLQNCRDTKMLKLWECLCSTLSFWLQLHKSLGT